MRWWIDCGGGEVATGMRPSEATRGTLTGMCELDGSVKQVPWARSIRAAFERVLGAREPTPEDSAVLGCTDSGLLIDYESTLKKGDSHAFCAALGVEWLEFSDIEDYGTFLLEKGRPPSQGGRSPPGAADELERQWRRARSRSGPLAR